MARIPDGTRYQLGHEWRWREDLRTRLEGVLQRWGYDVVQPPALERHDTTHPLADKSFKLIDRDGEVLALRSEYTTAIANLVRANMPQAAWPLRLAYGGNLWIRTRDAEIGRSREYTQIGAELLGVDNAESDAEMVALALAALQEANVEAVVELGHPGFVRGMLQRTGLGEDKLERLRVLVEHKDTGGLGEALQDLGVVGEARATLLALPDLYGRAEVLPQARALAHDEATHAAVTRLEGVYAALGEHGVAGRVLFDLGTARRFGYYSGIYFRCYTQDFGQPLAGGGRYNNPPPGEGERIPAIGFALGLERLMTALGTTPKMRGVDAVASDAASAKRLRNHGWRVILALGEDASTLAKKRDIPFVANHNGVQRLSDGRVFDWPELNGLKAEVQCGHD